MPSSPTVKRQRLLQHEALAKDDIPTQPIMMTTFSHETLLDICSFLGAEDVLALSRVSVSLSETLCESSVLWKQVVALAALDSSSSSSSGTTMMEEVVASLSRNKKNVDEAALWRRCALSQARARGQRLTEEPKDGPPKYYTPLNIPLPDERYRPRPLKAYSFILEMQDTVGSRRGRSIFLENIVEEESEVESLVFEIPKKHHDYRFSYVEDLGADPSNRFLRVLRMGTVFTVYAVDRSSGKQTKIYHSPKDRTAKLGQPPIGFYLTFPEQDCGTSEPVPYFKALIQMFWDYDGNGNRRLFLTLSLHFRNRNHDFENLFLDDKLLFLEKGRVYV